jgi:hypothetical protein
LIGWVIGWFITQTAFEIATQPEDEERWIITIIFFFGWWIVVGFAALFAVGWAIARGPKRAAKLLRDLWWKYWRYT